MRLLLLFFLRGSGYLWRPSDETLPLLSKLYESHRTRFQRSHLHMQGLRRNESNRNTTVGSERAKRKGEIMIRLSGVQVSKIEEALKSARRIEGNRYGAIETYGQQHRSWEMFFSILEQDGILKPESFCDAPHSLPVQSSLTT